MKKRLDQDLTTQRKRTAYEVAIYRAWGPQRKRRGRRVLPKQIVSKAMAVEYSRALRGLFRAALEAYKPLLEALAAATIRKDADDFPRKLKLQGREAKRLLDEAERRLQATVSTTQVETLASKFAARTSSYQRLQLGRQVRSALGAEPFLRESPLGGAADDFIAQNVSLIKRIPARLHEKIEGLVMNAVGKSTLNVNFADEIQKQFGVAERHATLIARDQLAKYYGAVNKARQEELGVTKFIWRTVNDERVRDSHALLEGNVYSWDDLPTNERGEEIYPGSDFQCFPGRTRVSTNSAVKKLYRRWYTGESTILTTDDGTTVETTPNHPVLTRRGWVPAHLVDVGDDVFQATLEGVDVGVQHGEHAQAAIEELFHTLAPLGVAQKVRTSVGGFHGDAVDEQVDVVDVQRALFHEGDPVFSESFGEQLLVLADDAPPAQGQLALLFDRATEASRSLVSRGCKLAALLGAGLRHPLEHRLAAITWLDTVTNKLTANGCTRDLEALREALDRPPVQDMQGPDLVTRIVLGIVRRAVMKTPGGDTPGAEMLAEVVGVDTELSCDLRERTGLQKVGRVVKKSVGELACHVYNLETSSSWYVAEGLAVHNCRCSAEPVLDDLLDDVDEAERDLTTPTFENFEEIDSDPEQDE